MPDLMTEFDDIIRALEEERPEIDPGFARSLDQRAADGFAKPPWHVRLPSFVWVGAPAGAVTALVIVVAIVGGGPGGSAGDDSSSGGSTGAAGGTVLSARPEPVPPDSQTSAQAMEDSAGGGESFERDVLRSKATADAVA